MGDAADDVFDAAWREGKYLERLYQNTWLCTNCGQRHSFTLNVCPKHLEKLKEK